QRPHPHQGSALTVLSYRPRRNRQMTSYPGAGQAYAWLEQAVNVPSDLGVLVPSAVRDRQCRSASVTSIPPITSEMRLYRNAMNRLISDQMSTMARPSTVSRAKIQPPLIEKDLSANRLRPNSLTCSTPPTAPSIA